MMMKSKAKAWKKLGEQAVKGVQDGMEKGRRLMYPIIMGLGTNIMTAYHHPSFKSGLMICIVESKEKHTPGTELSMEEFVKCKGKIRCEMYFTKKEVLERYIHALERLKEQWDKEMMD